MNVPLSDSRFDARHVFVADDLVESDHNKLMDTHQVPPIQSGDAGGSRSHSSPTAVIEPWAQWTLVTESRNRGSGIRRP